MKRPIGFIDSGVGGLTVLKEALKQLPNESMIFLGDSARCPYGTRPKEEIRQYTLEMVQFLLQKNIKMLVIACNTATAVVLEELQQTLEIPVVGVIQPGSLAAIKQTSNDRIGVLGTNATISSKVYPKTMHDKNKNIQVFDIACPNFVPLVENNQSDTPEAWEIVNETLKPLEGTNVDTVILGCTHYPLLRKTIQKVVGNQVSLIDSGAETVSSVSALLDYCKLSETPETNPNPTLEIYTTGDATLFEEIAENWLHRKRLEVKRVTLEEKLTPIQLDKEIVIATNNVGKAKEFAKIFEPKGYKVKTLKDFPELDEVEETGTTFEENARLKAETIANALQTIVLADDSGLCVDALEGLPGVYSARFAGEAKNDAANNAKLLSELGGLKGKERAAHFTCCLVLAAPFQESLVVQAECHGEIATLPSGDSGFGYDPLFLVPEYQKTFAELGMDIKNKISHRAKAIELLVGKWEQWTNSLGDVEETE
ncbi:glutamate racemase [uncultured Granulicatella sp.]|uniref:glutamate racemase n=1 Tax=uncultured Granulicatella sp. TaxID=316089 RepID=UPI002605FEA8|nr:glutamate racemase [uncultured Granulicatella sp.]